MRLTTGWTEAHTAVGGLLLAASAATFAGLGEGPPVSWAVACAVVVAGVAAMATDAFGGVLVGLVAAALLTGGRELTGYWEEPDFFWVLTETLAVVVLGALGGVVGGRLRSAARRGSGQELERDGITLTAAHGSLGLLPADLAMARLEEEAQRAATHRRPLQLVVFDVAVTDPGLPPEGRVAALRAFARLVENRAGESDVPFALAVDRLGLILPETTASRAWERVADVLAAHSDAGFTFGSGRQRVALGDALAVGVGIAGRGGPTSVGPSSWQAMLDEAVEAAHAPQVGEA